MDPNFKLITAVSLALCMTSGCLTPKVYNIGAENQRIDFQTAYVADDGGILLGGDLYRASGTYKRFALKNVGSWRQFLQLDYRKPDDTIRVDGPESHSVEGNKWRILSAMPKKYTTSTQVYNAARPLPYSVEGRTYYLEFFGMGSQWKTRTWWSYPCQILLIPAGAIDLAWGIIWAPIWILFFS